MLMAIAFHLGVMMFLTEDFIFFQYNNINDVTDDHRALVEDVSGDYLEKLSVDEVNDFLNGLYQFSANRKNDE